MKKIFLIILLILIGFWFYRSSPLKTLSPPITNDTDPTPPSNVQLFSDSTLGLEFEYKTGFDGYELQQVSENQGKNSPRVSLVLISTKDLSSQEKGSSQLAKEGYPTISINIFDNPQKKQPVTWILSNTLYSGYNLRRSEPRETTIGGANAIRYFVDGLYYSEDIVAVHNNYIYVFSGMYIDENSSLRSDFVKLLDTVKFIPSVSGSNAKININEVCQNALSYMTFPNGSAAEDFLKECLNGKRPEVIEKFKKDNNIDSDVAI